MHAKEVSHRIATSRRKTIFWAQKANEPKKCQIINNFFFFIFKKIAE